MTTTTTKEIEEMATERLLNDRFYDFKTMLEVGKTIYYKIKERHKSYYYIEEYLFIYADEEKHSFVFYKNSTEEFFTRCTDDLRQAADLYEHIHFDRVLDRLKLRLEQKIEAIINNHNFELKYKIIKDDNEESF